MIKTEVDASMCTDDDEDDTGEMGEDGEIDGDGDDGEDQENENENNEDMMITINTDGEQPELIISDSIENQA